MKRIRTIAIVLAFLGLAHAGLDTLFAENTRPAEGLDASEVLEALKKHVKDDKAPALQGRAAELLRISSDSILSPMFAIKGQSVSTLGWIFGPWQQFIHNNQYRPTALELLPRLEALPADVRDPLKRQWADIEAVRSRLLSDAASLEKVDAKLFDDGTALDRQAEELDRQTNKLRAEIREFNDTCVDRPLPPDQYQRCLRWQEDLKARIATHNQKIEKHNQQVEAWKKRAYGDQGVEGAGNALKQRIAAWGRTVLAFIDAAKKALEQHGTGKCTQAEFDERLEDMEKKAKKAKPCEEETGCADLGTRIGTNEEFLAAAQKVNECFDFKHPEYSKIAKEVEEVLKICRELFKRKCNGWDPHYGKCEPKKHDDYQFEVDLHCHGEHGGQVPVGCDPQSTDCDGSDGHKARLGRWKNCIRAREVINQICYEGGDQGHRRALEQARIVAGKCDDIIRDTCPCCKVGK